MFSLIFRSFIDFRRSWRKYLAFALFYLLLTSYLFVPLLAYLFNRLLVITGSGVLLNREVFRIFLNYRTALGLFFLAALAVLIIFIELGTLIIIAHKKYFKKPILITEAMLTALHSTHRILGVGILYLILLLLVMIPLVDLPIEPLISGLVELPALLMETLMASPLTRLLYWTTVIILAYILLRWIFVLHVILLDNQKARQAIKTSLRLTRAIRFSLLIGLVVMNLILFGLGILFFTGLNHLPQWMGVGTSVRLNQFLVTATGFMALLFTTMLMPVNIIFLTRLYYQASRRAGLPEGDQVHTFKINWMETGENLIDRLFRRRRTILMLFLLISLLASFYAGFALNQDLLYIGRNVAVAAHRADSINAPENSLSAIDSALAMGADVIEFDVQMTSDGVVVLHHDLTLTRMAGVPDRVSDLTWEELQLLEIGSRFSPEFAGERIPTLGEALERIADRAEVLIDVKVYGSTEELADQIVREVEKAGMVETSYVQSFDYELLREVRRLKPEIRIGQIMYYALGSLSRLDVDFYTIQTGMLSRDLVRRAKRLNRGVWVWTPRTEEEIKEVLLYDIDGLITSQVTLAREILGMEPVVVEEEED